MAPQRKNPSLAATASDQIRAIIEAAEQTAAQIRSEAEDEAVRIRREAEEEATGIRDEARGDVHELLESLREGVGRLAADLDRLGEKLAAPGPDDAAPVPVAEPVPRDENTRAAASSEPAAQAAEPAAASSEPAAPSDADLESARLVALNMALDGSSRDEVDRYLRENFALADSGALLDDVYASVGS